MGDPISRFFRVKLIHFYKSIFQVFQRQTAQVLFSLDHLKEIAITDNSWLAMNTVSCFPLVCRISLSCVKVSLALRSRTSERVVHYWNKCRAKSRAMLMQSYRNPSEVPGRAQHPARGTGGILDSPTLARVERAMLRHEEGVNRDEQSILRAQHTQVCWWFILILYFQGNKF